MKQYKLSKSVVEILLTEPEIGLVFHYLCILIDLFYATRCFKLIIENMAGITINITVCTVVFH